MTAFTASREHLEHVKTQDHLYKVHVLWFKIRVTKYIDLFTTRSVMVQI
jgi:hypothetical protein